MRIAIIGATGRTGGMIANEAWMRGHEVTAIVRNRDKVDVQRYGVIVKDLFELTEEDVEDFEVVVDAFNSSPGMEYQHETSLLKLIEVFKNLPDVRLIIVGGAGTLYTDSTRTRLAYELIPPEFAAVPLNMAKGFEALKKSKINWTFMSPAFIFDPNGIRTGRYSLGTDFLIKNRKGESYLSYADGALALVDEIERPQFIGKRFTLVSEGSAETSPDELPLSESSIPPRFGNYLRG